MVTTPKPNNKAPEIEAFPRQSNFYGGVVKRHDVPSSAGHFRSLFADWCLARFRADREAGADLFPAPGSLTAQLQDLADTAELGLRFDLTDTIVQSYFIEWLTEHPARADWWRRFLKLNGPCDTL